jgi:hypothetical protein
VPASLPRPARSEQALGVLIAAIPSNAEFPLSHYSVVADARRRSGAVPRIPSYAIDLWHPDLERFGARQVSDRFRAQYGAPMTSDAWEGWLAVKAAWESAVRARDGDVATELARGGFDGHKGVALRFSPDRMLIQPLFLVQRDATTQDGALTVLRQLPWPDVPASPWSDAAFDSPRCPS